MKATRNEMGVHHIYKHCTLVRRTELNGNKTIMSIWYFKIKIDLDGRLIKHKSQMCNHRGIHQFGVNYWEIFSPLVNWVSVRAMLALSILRDIHTKSVSFVLAYT